MMAAPGPAPTMAGWNLALRFGLELMALTGLAIAAWKLAPTSGRTASAIVVPIAAAVVWVVFNVVGDPSRSGEAPVEVPGWLRLLLEAAILGGGAIAYGVAGRHDIAIAYGVVLVMHYAMSLPRLRWLLGA